MGNTHRLPVPVTLLALVAVACNKPAESPRKTVLPPRNAPRHTQVASAAIKGWVETKCAGVAFSLPPDLAVFDLTSRNANIIDTGVKKAFPHSPADQKAIADAVSNGNIKLFAMQKKASDSKSSNKMSLVETAIANGVDEAQLLAANQSQLGELPGASVIKAQLKTIPAGKAAYNETLLSMATERFAIYSYALIHDGKQYVFTFTGRPDGAVKWREVAEKSMNSMRFLD